MTNLTPALDAGRVTDASRPEIAARYKLNDIFCQAWLSHAVTAVARLGIADALGEAPLSAAAIARLTNLDWQAVGRLLRALSANGIFDQIDEGLFAHNSVSRLLRKHEPDSWCGMALMWNHPSCLEGWKHFTGCIQDGRSGIEHAFGKTLYEHLGEEPAATMAFSDAMISNSSHVSREIARQFPFEKYKSVIDLGGGIGTLLCAITDEHPQLDAAVYEIRDLEIAAKQNIGDRGKVIVGNFLESVPGDFDLYLVKNSLWNWDDDNCLAIMNNVRQAIGHNTYRRFVIIEYIIDHDNAPWTTLYDLQILNMPGGRARTTREYSDLLAESNFTIDRQMRIEDQTLLIARPV